MSEETSFRDRVRNNLNAILARIRQLSCCGSDAVRESDEENSHPTRKSKRNKSSLRHGNKAFSVKQSNSARVLDDGPSSKWLPGRKRSKRTKASETCGEQKMTEQLETNDLEDLESFVNPGELEPTAPAAGNPASIGNPGAPRHVSHRKLSGFGDWWHGTPASVTSSAASPSAPPVSDAAAPVHPVVLPSRNLGATNNNNHGHSTAAPSRISSSSSLNRDRIIDEILDDTTSPASDVDAPVDPVALPSRNLGATNNNNHGHPAAGPSRSSSSSSLDHDRILDELLDETAPVEAASGVSAVFACGSHSSLGSLNSLTRECILDQLLAETTHDSAPSDDEMEVAQERVGNQ